MGGRGARARPKRKLTDEEIAAVAPPEQPTDPPSLDEPEQPWWDDTRSSKDWSSETVEWDTKLYDALLTVSGKDKPDGTQWINLADLRPLLGGTREEQDANLKRLSREGVIGISPTHARMQLRQEDHDAALTLGGEPQHQVSWDYSVYPDRPEAAPKHREQP